MSFQPGANVYTQGFGSRPENVEVPHIEIRDPSTSDINYPIGKRWVNTASENEFILYSFTSTNGVTQANWATPVGATGAIVSLSDASDVKVLPDSTGNIQITQVDGQTSVIADLSAHSLAIGLANPLTVGAINVLGTANINTTTNDNTVIGSTTPSSQTLTVGCKTIFSNIFTLDNQFVSAGTYHATGQEGFFNCNAASGVITIDLAANYTYGSMFVIADTSGGAGTNTITINAGAGFVFISPSRNQVASVTISDAFGAYLFVTTQVGIIVLATAV